MVWVVIMLTRTINRFLYGEPIDKPEVVYVAILGLLTVVTALYQWDRARD